MSFSFPHSSGFILLSHFHECLQSELTQHEHVATHHVSHKSPRYHDETQTEEERLQELKYVWCSHVEFFHRICFYLSRNKAFRTIQNEASFL